jgi:hypothetical protein
LKGEEVQVARPAAKMTLSVDERKAVFLVLVQLQDAGSGVAKSRDEVALRFGLKQPQVRRIESEGLSAEWPPL